ncbi:DUF695 domain-containing protein [Actinomadura macrotermitis]|uniref:DUF695 domain-containing protein n=1 Tax=Actinomadura macrotermitis TaxID=2585200 RepID=A0A7K0BPR9_9ACTN|nr:DUF695 domain-containing protein [Actinomadura macrotermitis]MQY03153.1 hypothetical protein [Actinomadura macrotermitis]
MGIFRRPRDISSAALLPAISEFWEWWSQARPSIEAALAAAEGAAPGEGLPAEMVEELSQRVARIHPELQWEIGGPDDRSPTLTLTGGGDPELRGLTERWLRALPRGAAGDWRFHPARQADPEMLAQELVLGDHEFDLEYVRLGMRADQNRARVDITAYHPDFLFVSEEQQAQVTLHVLDWALGEDDVARWIGEVGIAAEAPIDALPPVMLPAVVEQVAEPFEEPAWLTGEGRTPRGHPSRMAVRFPLHRQDHPLCDMHVTVTLPYANSNPDRLPVEPSAKALRQFEKKLESLGERAVLAVRETGDGLRVFHLYADPDSSAISDLDQLAAAWPEGKAKVSATSDPGWRVLAPYRL